MIQDGDRTSPAAELERVSVVLGGRTILDDISLRIEPGEFVAILGANGAGKSTLLKAMLGLVQPASGSIRVLGQSPSRGRAQVGYCPQVRTLDRETPLRARDLVGLGLDGHRWGFGGTSAAERSRRVEQALREVDALQFANAAVGRLSGGEQQRLAIAQALLSRPQLLLMDEPLSNLDMRSQHDIVSLVDRLRKEFNIAVLLVTHGVNPLLEVIDRVCYVASGRAVVGSVDEVIRSEVLSQLYGSPIEVVKAGGRFFVAADVDDEHFH